MPWGGSPQRSRAAGRMGSRDGKKWTCGKCSEWNWGDRAKCHGCGAARAGGSRDPPTAKKPKKAREAATVDSHGFVLAGGTRRQARSQARSMDKMVARLEQLEAEEKKRKASPLALADGSPDAPQPEEAKSERAELAEAVTKAEQSLKLCKEWAKVAPEQAGGCAEKAEEVLAEARRANRKAKPAKDRYHEAVGKIKTKEGQLAQKEARAK